MKSERADFRDQLLAAQRTTPALREDYQKELEALLHHRLTPQTWLLTWGGVFAAVATAALCIRAMIRYPYSSFVNGTFAVVALLVAIWLGRVLWQGGFARRASYAVIEGLGGIATGAFVLVTLFQGMSAPSNPASTFGASMAILLVMAGFAWGTGNRIAAAKLEMREHLLRLESRLADLAERLGK
jgi:hypothetical protein